MGELAKGIANGSVDGSKAILLSSSTAVVGDKMFLRGRYSVSMMQELMGHKDVNTHVLNRGGKVYGA